MTCGVGASHKHLRLSGFSLAEILVILLCFLEHKSGLILFFTLKYDTMAYFLVCLTFHISKKHCKVENYDISKRT